MNDRLTLISPMIYANQFIEVTFAINATHVYGIGERYGPLMLNASADWQTFPLWTLDQAVGVCDNGNSDIFRYNSSNLFNLLHARSRK